MRQPMTVEESAPRKPFLSLLDAEAAAARRFCTEVAFDPREPSLDA